MEKPRAGSEIPNSPKPYEDIKGSKRSGLTPMTQERYKKNYLNNKGSEALLPARGSLNGLERPTVVDGLTAISYGNMGSDTRLQKK